MNVPFFENQQSVERTMPALSAELDKMLGQEALVNGDAVRQFEVAICEYTGAKHAIATGNGTDALILSLMALGIGPGDEVIVPCYSFFASVSSVLLVGGTPIFVDIEEHSYSLDVSQLEQCITSRTKAVMPVHLFRQMADMKHLKEVVAHHDLVVLEDSAEGIGMYDASIHAGLHGDMGVLSFFPTKTLGALGDAGMILTNNSDHAERARQLADNGRDGAGIAQIGGFNSRMDDLQAICLRLRMGFLDEDIQRRADIAALYGERLAKAAPHVTPPKFLKRGQPQNIVDYVYLIQCERRDELADHLTNQGIGTEPYYPRPLHLQPACESLGYKLGDFPVAEKLAQGALGLPMYADLSDDAVVRVSDLIADFYQ